MPPELLVLAMPSSYSAPVMCPTAAIVIPTEAIANVLRLHWGRALHQSLSTAIVSACEVGVYLGPEEAGENTRQCLSHKATTRAGSLNGDTYFARY